MRMGPGGVIAIVFGVVFVLGGALTAPLWGLFFGFDAHRASAIGLPLLMAAGGVLIVAAVLLPRLKAWGRALDAASRLSPEPTAKSERRKAVLIEVVVMLMFVVPFLTILVGWVFNKYIDAGG